jgi:hypothetical protein
MHVPPPGQEGQVGAEKVADTWTFAMKDLFEPQDPRERRFLVIPSFSTSMEAIIDVKTYQEPLGFSQSSMEHVQKSPTSSMVTDKSLARVMHNPVDGVSETPDFVGDTEDQTKEKSTTVMTRRHPQQWRRRPRENMIHHQLSSNLKMHWRTSTSYCALPSATSDRNTKTPALTRRQLNA